MRRPNRRRFSGRRAGSRRGSNLARSPAQGISRRRFLGTAAAGVGAVALGASGVARAQTPPGSNGAVATYHIYGNPFMITFQDPDSGLVTACLSKDPDDPNLSMIFEGRSVDLENTPAPEFFASTEYPGFADISVIKARNVPSIVWKDIPTIPQPPSYPPLLPHQVVAAAFLTTLSNYMNSMSPVEALRQTLYDLEDGILNLLDENGNPVFYLAECCVALGESSIHVTHTSVVQPNFAANANGVLDSVYYYRGEIVDSGEDVRLVMSMTGNMEIPMYPPGHPLQGQPIIDPLTGKPWTGAQSIKHVKVKLIPLR